MPRQVQPRSTSLFLPPSEIDCGISVGLGYGRFSHLRRGDRELWELAYINLDVKPNGSGDDSGDLELVIRTDSTIPAAGGIEGDRALQPWSISADRTDSTCIFISMKIGLEPPR